MHEYMKLAEDSLDEIISLTEAQKSAEFNWDRQKIISSAKGAELYGARDKSQALKAFVLLKRLNKDTFELECLATHLEAQGQGVMFALLNWVFTKYNGTAREVWLEVHEKNYRAYALYQKLGFVQTGQRSRYYPDGSAAILCTKII